MSLIKRVRIYLNPSHFLYGNILFKIKDNEDKRNCHAFQCILFQGMEIFTDKDLKQAAGDYLTLVSTDTAICQMLKDKGFACEKSAPNGSKVPLSVTISSENAEKIWSEQEKLQITKSRLVDDILSQHFSHCCCSPAISSTHKGKAKVIGG